MNEITANKTPAIKTPAIEKVAYSINEFCAAHDIGRTQTYEEINTGRLEIAKVGKRTIVPVTSARKWLAARMQEAKLLPPQNKRSATS